jgi:undecaprenyl-diphosphatase
VSLLEAIVLGAVQGLTEFIPISSSGHLVIVPELFGWKHPGLAFDVLLHAASLLALLVYFSGDLLDLARGVMGKSRGSRKLVGLLALGTIPAALAGLLFSDYFEEQFEDARAAALQLLITAVILVGAEQIYRTHERKTANKGKRLRTMDDMNYVDAGAIGVAQAISIFPGISRSGATIGTGLALSIERSNAARFAFLLAIPSLLGATIIEVPEINGATLGAGPAIAGFISSLVTSYAAIWGLIKYLRSNTLYPFAAYCVVAGIVFFAIL